MFDISIGGKTYRVEIPDPAASPLLVIVDGEAFDVDIASTQPGTSSVSSPQLTQLPPARTVAINRPASPSGSEGTITAPMPGTILSVEVAVGQQLEAGQIVCVLEAMKMKNPIRTTGHGTVGDIAVRPGQTVGFGDLLVRLS